MERRVKMISEELKELIRPHLISMIPEEDVPRIEEMFSEVYYTTLDDIQRVTVKPITSGTLTAQFSLYSGEFLEMTDWDYIQTVGTTIEPSRNEYSKDPNEKIVTALKHYLKTDYHLLSDFYKIVENREEVATGIYKYSCPFQIIYLDDECYPMTRGNQKVDIENNRYYYNFNQVSANSTSEEDLFECIGTYEWKRNTNIWR